MDRLLGGMLWLIIACSGIGAAGAVSNIVRHGDWSYATNVGVSVALLVIGIALILQRREERKK